MIWKRGFLPMAAVMVFVGALLLRRPDYGALVVNYYCHDDPVF
jgi:cell division protein FtsW (lipid II flippase)